MLNQDFLSFRDYRVRADGIIGLCFINRVRADGSRVVF